MMMTPPFRVSKADILPLNHVMTSNIIVSGYKNTFSHLVRRPEWYLIEHVLKIKITLQLHKYTQYIPLEWQRDLGHHQYDGYLNFLIEFTIILKVAHRQFRSIPWDDYKIM